MKAKKKQRQSLLAWADASLGTGFGVVSKHVLTSLYNTGKYEINQLGINFHGDFVDKDIYPWDVQPAKLLDPRDPHGIKMFFRSLMRKKYDIVWILNDLYVTTQVADYIRKVKDRYITMGKKPPIFVHYYPVDCHVPEDSTGALDLVDVPVCYTEHGRLETLKTRPKILDRLKEIPHGVDSHIFYPLPKKQIINSKRDFFKVDKDTFVVVQVNRNSTRKQIPYSMLAFKEFKKLVPNSIMYVHTMAKDQGGDLIRVMQDLELDPIKDIIFPAKYSPTNPAPAHILNALYNTGDLFLTCHLGGGWELPVTEAMAAGVPVVAPDNTCMPQQLGKNGERGYMYECKDYTYIDSSGFRPKGLIPDIVDKMMQVYDAGPKQVNPVVKAAREWAVQHDWKQVNKQWVELFDNLEHKEVVDKKEVITQEV